MATWARSGPGGGVLVDLQVVPGGRRDGILGPHGDRLRVKVAAPPEGGRANRAVCALLAGRLGLRPRAVVLLAGTTSPRKTVRVDGLPLASVVGSLAPGTPP